jgi:hypothetical protein
MCVHSGIPVVKEFDSFVECVRPMDDVDVAGSDRQLLQPNTIGLLRHH